MMCHMSLSKTVMCLLEWVCVYHNGMCLLKVMCLLYEMFTCGIRNPHAIRRERLSCIIIFLFIIHIV